MQPAAILVAAEEVERFSAAKGWRFCFIGGLAVQRWGEQRVTVDVDLITLLTGLGGEETYVDELLSSFAPRREDARAFALRNRVLLLKAAGGIGVDIALGAFPFEERSVARASRWVVWAEGRAVTTCSAEDLLVS